MSKSNAFAGCALVALSHLALTGCLNLKPVTDPARFYVLSAMPPETQGAAGPQSGLRLGLAPVELPAYLLNSRIAFRKSSTEIQYSETERWAERLDKGLQRVLTANLSSLLQPGTVVLSAWERRDVGTEVYVAVERFEGDAQGQVALEARWRITAPGGEETLRAGSSRVTKQGPPLPANPPGAVNELSEALADLSREIAAALRAISVEAKRE